MKQQFRNWATPLATGMFFISAVTGLLLFFHIDPGITKSVHKWQSWILVAGAVFHTAANWKAFKSHFTHQTGMTIIGLSLLLTLITVSPFFGNDNRANKKATAMASMKLLQESTLSSMASLMEEPPERLQSTLEKHGISADDHTLTLRQIARLNGIDGRKVLATIVLSGDQNRKNNKTRPNNHSSQ